MKRSGLSLTAGGLLLFALSALPSLALELGAILPSADLKMTNAAGTRMSMSLADVQGKAGTLVIFTCNHCPFVKAWQDRMVRLANIYVEKGVGVAFINANDPVAIAEDDLDNMQKLATAKNYAFPYLVDGTSDLARAFGATRTPEAFLFDSEGKLVYHGTIDDSMHEATKVTQPYLENALAALVAGKAIAEPETKSVGCTIKFRAKAK